MLSKKYVMFFLLAYFLSSSIASTLHAQSSNCSEQLADVVIMLDRSSSIDRSTELPYEAAAAKTLLDTFTSLGLDNMVAVGAFSSTADILTDGHLTTDYDALKTSIDTYLNIPTSGTNIEDAIQESEVELNTGANPLKYIILISDGQATRRNTSSLTNAEAALQAAQTAKNNGINIVTIAYDSSDGSSAAISGRLLLAAMASGNSDDDTSGSIDSTERDLENSDGDYFYVAPSVTDLGGLFENIANSINDSITCDDADTCTLDVCDETTRTCSFTEIDSDTDGTPDCRDNCPNDILKTEGGDCGCNASDADTDGDGTADCNDLCPADSAKIIPGVCDCGVADTDADGDGTADCYDDCSADTDTDEDGTVDCLDFCPLDADKIIPGQCDCGTVDTDTDLDGSADCLDGCDHDPAKSAPGVCGCGEVDADSDEDGTLNCNDQCPIDSAKIIPGDCGCGSVDMDVDGDGTADCTDSCPADSGKNLPGQCGCGVEDTDSDGDSTADCDDLCSGDSLKTEPGICGCGVSDVDSDADGTADCDDLCANDPEKTSPGACGCGVSDTDADGDGVSCSDECPSDADKTVSGTCGCGASDIDSDSDGMANCVDQCPDDPDASELADCQDDEEEEDDDDEDEDPDSDSDPDSETSEDAGSDPSPDTSSDPDAQPNPSAGGTVCDVSLDANADGLPDDLDPTLDDADGDGVPDCCTSGNADDDLLDFDSDGDGISNCTEFDFGTNPSVNDISPQGSGTTLSLGSCSLSSATTNSGKTNRTEALLFMSLSALVLAFVRFQAKGSLKTPMAVLLVISLFFGGSSYAFNVQSFSPSHGAGSGLGLATSKTVAPGHLVLGSFFNYVEHPFELGQINNDPKIIGIVDRFITSDLIATVGLLDFLDLTVNMPINLYHDIAPTFIPNRDSGGMDAGDLRVNAKIQLLNADATSGHWGLAFIPFATAPTGDEDIFFGDDGAAGGAVIAGDKKFGPHRLYTNIGARFKKKESLNNLIVDDSLTFGVGYQHQFSKNHAISGIAEFQGSTTFRKFLNEEITTPLEIRAVAQKDFLNARNLHVNAGGALGLSNGYGAPDFRFLSGASMDFDFSKKEKVKQAKKTDSFVEIVFFATDKDQFYPVHSVNIQKAANYWKTHDDNHVILVGHTDSNADSEYNQRLSERRTRAVMNALIKQGVPRDKIQFSYFGEAKPRDNNETETGRQNNRRVEIQISKK